MRVNIRCHICLSFDQSVWSYIVNTYSVTEDVHFSFVVLPATSNCRQLFCTDVVNWSYTTVPLCSVPTTVPVHFTNLKAQKRYLPIIRGTGTPFLCVPRHGNHCLSAICISLLQTYSKLFRPNQNVLIDESMERWTRVGLTHRLCWVQLYCIGLVWVRFFICQWLGCCNSLNCKIHISSALLQYYKFIMPLMI